MMLLCELEFMYLCIYLCKIASKSIVEYSTIFILQLIFWYIFLKDKEEDGGKQCHLLGICLPLCLATYMHYAN